MLKIRLRRMGNRNRPFYRVVLSDSRKATTSRALEELGHYDPRNKESGVQIDVERVRHWEAQGALLSPAVARVINRGAGSPEAPERAAAPAEEPEQQASEAEPEAPAEAVDAEKSAEEAADSEEAADAGKEEDAEASAA